MYIFIQFSIGNVFLLLFFFRFETSNEIREKSKKVWSKFEVHRCITWMCRNNLNLHVICGMCG